MRDWLMCALVSLSSGSSQSTTDGSQQSEAKDLRAPTSFGRKVITSQAAKATQEDWGTFREYFVGPTGGMKEMLYAKALDSRGIRNSTSEPLTYVFWKWNSKGVPVSETPSQP